MYFGELLARGPSLALAIWGMYFGILLACLLALYEKRVIGKFVRELLRREAFSPEKALTLAELGCDKNPFLRSSLRGKTALSALVYMPGEDTGLPIDAPEEDPHPRPAIRSRKDIEGSDVRFYIPAPLRHRAAVRYDQHGTHLMAVIMAALAFAVAAIALLWGLPKIIDLVNDLFSSLLF